jgi:predicted ATPase
MIKHLTVRLAWHDNKWNGNVCEDPESNVYCVGSHSLLSARIAKNRDLDIEKKNKGKRIDKLGKYLPPCYWSTNAFSKQALTVWHKHPFPEFEKKHVINDKLSGYSVFTWPFHVGYVLDNKKKERAGRYPMDLDDRIDQFQNFFSKGKSLVFLYLNYDNPISAEDSKYALVGCATLNKITPGKDYSFTKAELKTLRSQGSGKSSMKNFPTLNWAMTVSYDFDSGVVLPYHEYLEHKKNSGDSESLDEMKILIDEEDLQQNFKYVAMDMDDDACIYLLTRLRNSFEKIKGHGIIPATRAKAEIKKIDKLLERSWKARGTYPSLGNVLDVIANMGIGNPGIGNEIVSVVEKNNQGKVNLDVIVKLLNKKNIPKYLDNDKFRATITEISVNIKGENLKLLQKLSLFSLSQTQIKNIIRNNEKSFRKLIDVNEIVENPYLLCENYKGPNFINRDELEIPDKKIGTFTIDIGMFPDPNYLGRNKAVQNLDVSHPYRLRAVISDHLKSLENDGDCYAVLDDILKMLKDYPLFYRPEDELLIDKNKLASVKYIDHFKERLEVIDKKFFYLTEIKKAEDLIKTTIQKLLERDDHKTTVDDLDKFLKGEADTLSKTIKGFERNQFIDERTKLIEGCIKKSFFVITGKPGSGKTKALKKVVDEIKKAGEKFVVLAPTGKASLRLREAIEDPNAQTIDKFIHSKGYNKILEDFESFSPTEPSKDVFEVKNLIIDESSMLDLKKVAVLFKMLYGRSTNTGYTNRVIFVGDENQLPPIGYGKPFFDIIKYLKEKKYADKNFVRLETNCRQRFDDKILKIADLFRGEKTCYEELISGISSGKFSSAGFHVELWDDETELYQKIDARLGEAVKDLGVKIPKEKSSQMNLLFGLNENGSVQGNFKDTMKLDR